MPLIALDNSEDPYAQSYPFEGADSVDLLKIITQVFDTLLENGWGFKEARHCLSSMEPFINQEDLITVMVEQYQKRENK